MQAAKHMITALTSSTRARRSPKGLSARPCSGRAEDRRYPASGGYRDWSACMSNRCCITANTNARRPVIIISNPNSWGLIKRASGGSARSGDAEKLLNTEAEGYQRNGGSDPRQQRSLVSNQGSLNCKHCRCVQEDSALARHVPSPAVPFGLKLTQYGFRWPEPFYSSGPAREDTLASR